MDAIRRFRGEYFFLSNFYETNVTIDGLTFPSSEAEFQAQKTMNSFFRNKFTYLNPVRAKHLGNEVPLREDWDTYRDEAMYRAVKAKFEQNDWIRELLIRTGDAYLEEGNRWHDTYWGTVNGVGKNMLGKTLMRVREELRANEKAS